MAELDDLRINLRQLIELERDSGVEWLPVPPAPATPPPTTARDTQGDVAPARRPAPVAAAIEVTAWTAPADLIDQPAAEAVATIRAEVTACTRCGLCPGRTKVVPGEGSPTPEIVFIGEAPDSDEDQQGRPFVGEAGALLDKMIAAMGFQRDQVYLCNAVKCRPPGNRMPEANELDACHPFLMAELSVLRPKVICTLGNIPLRALFGHQTAGITRMRGQRLEWQGIPVYPTFHPSYLLRNEAAKKPAWEDLKAVLAEIGREPPGRR